MKAILILVLLYISVIASDTNNTLEIKSVLEETQQNVEELNNTINQNQKIILEHIDKIKYVNKNRTVLYKDIETLYDIVIGDDYDFKTLRNCDESLKCKENEKITGIITYYKSSWFSNDELVIDRDLNHTINARGTVDRYKLLAVEESLGIDNTEKNTTIRIGKLYEQIGYTDWDQDRIQFMVLVNYLAKDSAVVSSIGVLVYPSYKKYIPGNINLPNRYAIYLAIGKADPLESTKEFHGITYSAGLSIELQKGFGINIGWMLYSKKEEPSSDNYSSRNSFVAGATLSSELWKNLFNF